MYPIIQNPFYNGTAPHGYSVLNDWNQDNPLVQQQWHDALAYWMEAYNVTPQIGNKSVTLPAGAYVVIGTKDLADRDEIAADGSYSTVNVYGGEGCIIIDGIYDRADVYDISGSRTDRTDSLAPGIYVVVVDGHTSKVAVR